MDQFFVRLFFENAGMLLASQVLLFLAGGLSGILFSDVKISLRRLTYFFSSSLLTFSFSLSQIIWLKAPGTIPSACIIPLILIGLIACFLFGFGVHYCAAARCNSIEGTSKKAWMAFVPLVNFWLVITPAKRTFDGPIEESSPFGSVAIDFGLFAGGLFLLFSSFDLQGLMIKDLAAAGGRQAGQIETVMANISQQMQKDLPIWVDEQTFITEVSAEGDRLWIRHTITDASLPANPHLIIHLRDFHCALTASRTVFAIGGRFDISYHYRDGTMIDRLVIDDEECRR